MASMERCLKKLGKRVSSAEKQELKLAAKAYLDEGYGAQESAHRAVMDAIKDTADERSKVLAQIRKAAGMEAPTAEKGEKAPPKPLPTKKREPKPKKEVTGKRKPKDITPVAPVVPKEEPIPPPPEKEKTGKEWVAQEGSRVVMGEDTHGTVLSIQGDRAKVRLDNAPHPRAYVNVSTAMLRPESAPEPSPIPQAIYSKLVAKQGKFGMNKQDMISLFGEQMYRTDTALASIKELAQNAFDAVKGYLHSKKKGKGIGHITIHLDHEERSITVKDDGIGMTEKIVDEAFFTMAGSEKSDLPPGLRSGGLGLAKLLFMFSSERIELDTVRDGVRLKVSATPEQILNDDFKIVPSAAPKSEHGTTVKVFIPKYRENPRTGERETIGFPYGLDAIYPLKKPLIGPVEFRFTDNYGADKILPIGSNFDPKARNTPLLTRAKFSWGKADVYFGDERVRYASHQILSSGIYQFDHPFKKDQQNQIPYNIIINIQPDVDAKDADYPFNNTREGFKERIMDDINSLAAYLKKVSMGNEAEAVQKSFENIKSMPKLEVGEEIKEAAEKADLERAQKAFEEEKAKTKRKEAEPPPYREPEIEVTPDEVRDTKGNRLAEREKPEAAEKKRKEATFEPDKRAPELEDFLTAIDADPGKPIFHNNTNLDVIEVGKAAGGNPELMLAELGSLMVEMRDALANGGLWGYESMKGLFYTGISVDKGYAGVYLNVPFSAVLLNPFGRNYYGKTLFSVREMIYNTMVHEFAHNTVQSHGEHHNIAMEEVAGWLSDNGLTDYFRDTILHVLLKHEAAFTEIRRQYERSSTKNLAQSFKESGTARHIGAAEDVGGAAGGAVQGGGGQVRGGAVPGRASVDRGGGEPGGAAEGLSPLALKNVFPGADIVQNIKGGWSVVTGTGAVIEIRNGVVYNRADVEKQIGRPMKVGERVTGMWTRMGKGGIVALIDGATDFTAHHEAFHAIMDLALTAAERRVILEAYGDHETAADAYGRWRVKRSSQTAVGRLFTKLMDAAVRLRDAVFGPSAAGVMRTVESGKALERTEAEVGAGKGRARFKITGVPESKADRAAYNLSNIGVMNRTEVRQPGSKVKGEVAGELQARSRKLLEKMGITPGDLSDPRLRTLMSDAIALEIKAAMEKSGHAGDWYSTKIDNAMKVAELIHPELATSDKARLAYRMALAVTSQNQSVPDNTSLANKQYEAFKETGVFPVIGSGTASKQMKQNFRKLNALFADYDHVKIEKFLNTEFTVKELATAGWSVAGELTTAKVYGSAILGPKIGNGFYQNINGNFSPLTVDMWFMRGFGRLAGDLLPGNETLIRSQMARLRQSLTSPIAYRENQVLDWKTLEPRPDAEIEGGFTEEAIKDDDVLLELANRLDSWFTRERQKNIKDYDSGRYAKPEAVFAAQSLLTNGQPKDSPANGHHRQVIREVFQEAVDKLAGEGIPLTTADAQALWWYPEKELYAKLGYRMTRAVPTDYEQEMVKIAKEKGVSDDRIQAAIGGAGGRGAGAERGGTVAGGEGARASDRAGLNARERAKFLAERAVRTYRRGVGADPSQPSGPYTRKSLADGGGVRVLGASPIAEYTLQTVPSNRFKEGQIPRVPFYELNSTDAGVFHRAMTEATQANPFSAAVYIYPEDEYAGMRLFLSKDGTSGMALKGQDLVSAFSTPGKAPAGIIHAMLQLGIQEGGRTLDCFDTVLPEFYSIHGIRIVARIPWDDSQAPDNWDKNRFKEFNNGEPDVVFGVYDHNYDDLYKAGDGKMFTDYGEAVDHQAAELERLSKEPVTIRPRFSVEQTDNRETIDTYRGKKVAPLAVKPSLMERLKQYTDYDHIKSTVIPGLRQAWEKFYTETVAEHYPIEKLADMGERATILGIPRKAGEILRGMLAAHRGSQGTANQALLGEGVWLPVMERGVESKESIALREDIEELERKLEETEDGSKEQWVLQQKLERKLDKLDSVMSRAYASGELEKVHDSLQTVTEPLRALAEKRGVDADQVFNDLFQAKMVAERDLELSGNIGDRAKLIDKGVDPDAAAQVLQALKAEYGEDYQTLEDVGKRVRSWADAAIIEPLVRSGRLDPVVASKIRRSNQFYVPFFRVIEEMEEKGFVAGSDHVFEVRRIPVMEIKGSERKIVDPLSMFVKLAFNSADVAGRAHVARSIAEIPLFTDAAPDIRTVRAKFFPVPVELKQEIDPELRYTLNGVAQSLKADIKVKERLRGRAGALGRYLREIRSEATAGHITQEEKHWIEMMFGTTEKTLAHEIGHAIDAYYSDRVGEDGKKIGKLEEILMATPQMKRELREVADRRLGDASSKSYRKYVRSKPEQVAEFVAVYLADRYTAINYAPHVVEAFETFARAHEEIKPLTNVRSSGQVSTMTMQGSTWVKSPFAPQPNTMLYYRDGRAHWLHLPPDLYRAAMGMNHGDVGVLMKIASAPAKWLRSGAVLTPEFISRNPLRDIIMAWVFSRHGFSMAGWLGDLYRVVTGDDKAKEAFAKFEGGGGAFSDLASMFVETQAITAEKIMGKRKGIKYCAHPMDALREVSSFVESLTRYSVYRQAIANGASHAQAIHEARTITLDFHRMGSNPYVRALNMIIPFFNASVQGMDKLGSELLSGDRKRSGKVLLRIALGITLPSILLWAMFGDDDRVKELEAWERNLFWHIPLPGGPILRFPKPFEVGIAFGSVVERMLDWYAKGDTAGLKKALAQAADAATPPMMPAIMRPFLEQSANWNYFMERKIEDDGLRALPVELRAKPWTSEAAKFFSAMGGKYAGLSPVMVEHHVRAMFGGLGASYVLPAIDFAMRKTGVTADIPKADQPLYNTIPFARALFSREPTGFRSKTSNDFYEHHGKALMADQGWKSLIEHGQSEDAYRMLADNPEAVYARSIRKTLTEVSKVKKERDAVVASPALDSATKTARVEEMDARIGELVSVQVAMMHPDIMEKAVAPTLTGIKTVSADKKSIAKYYEFANEPIARARAAVMAEWGTISKMTQSERNNRILSIIKKEQKNG